MVGTLYLVGTPIGNMEDITLRALRVISEVDVLAAEDTRAAQHLLARHGHWPRPPGKRMCSLFTGNEASRGDELLGLLQDGANVAVISEAGLPGVSDPGQRLVAAAAAAGVRVEVIPGPSAVQTALVGSGLPTERYLFLGFPPRTEGERQALFGSLRRESATLVLLESPERTGRTLADLAAALSPERAACVARELTKLHEEYVRAPLGELAARYAEVSPRGEVTLVVAGAPAAAVGTEEMGEVEMETAIRERLTAGQGAREIAAALALRTGRPRRQIYQLVVALSEPGVRR